MSKQLVLRPPVGFDGTGLYVGGGWHALQDVDGAPALVLPAEGNWQSLAGLGFVEATPASADPQ